MVTDPPFAITVTDHYLAVAGEVDAATSPALRDAIRAAAAVNARPPLHVEMSNVSFMDSSGLSALVAAYRRSHGAIRVIAPSPSVTRILELTGLYDHLVGAPSS